MTPWELALNILTSKPAPLTPAPVPRRPPLFTPTECRDCRIPFSPDNFYYNHSSRHYNKSCKACARIRADNRKRERQASTPREKICPGCGIIFPYSRSDAEACSKKCRARIARSKRKELAMNK